MSKEGLYLFSEDLTVDSQFLAPINHANVEILSRLKSLHFSFKIKLCMQNMVNLREELTHFSLEVKTEKECIEELLKWTGFYVLCRKRLHLVELSEALLY